MNLEEVEEKWENEERKKNKEEEERIQRRNEFLEKWYAIWKKNREKHYPPPLDRLFRPLTCPVCGGKELEQLFNPERSMFHWNCYYPEEIKDVVFTSGIWRAKLSFYTCEKCGYQYAKKKYTRFEDA